MSVRKMSTPFAERLRIETMWILRFLRSVGRLLLDFLFILGGVIVAAYVFNAAGFVLAVVLAIPTWLVFAWVYKIVFGPRPAAA